VRRGVGAGPRQQTHVEDRIEDGLLQHRLRTRAKLREPHAAALPERAQRHLE